ncbi:MAG: hypothetical protein OEW64_14435 [Gammaproteobacteria bacterium]|nr:hypothetical protein [Gammaproteobacteria bacterium]MDH5305281.1 hypothetical protein [Gammaproteobacteria bacterium]MDH5321561.1 hypothetical protein [Gammaproteobacteria bacterium]
MRSIPSTVVLLIFLTASVFAQEQGGAYHYELGSQLLDSGEDLEAAAQHFERAAELGYQPLGTAYRLARIYARQGETDKALQQLEILAAGGFGQINLLAAEADFDGLRADARFIAATAAIRASRFPCEADERHHAFDFWIGEWNVTLNGRLAGTNSVQPMLGHCTIFEQWESVSGGLGKSFNFYDPGADHWRQIWISDNGTFIEFTGVARDGGIFFTAQTTNPADGSVTDHKFEFTQLAGGIVRQSWETSTDDGATWTSVWDGRYQRKPE